MSSPLTVGPAEVVALAEGHDKVGAAVLADATTACVSGQMAAAYGPAGAVFTAAVAAFEAAVAAAGSEVAQNYRQMSDALRSGAQSFETTDAASAARFAPATGSHR